MNSCDALQAIDSTACRIQILAKLTRRLQGVTRDLAEAVTGDDEGLDFIAHHLKDIVTGEDLSVLARVVREAIEKQGGV